jgi:hypothetical protein
MARNDNTRWHWGSKINTPEPAIPWCGLMWPDGLPVSYTEVAAGGKVIFMRPCILNEGFSIQNKTRGHENDFTAHGYTEAHAIAAWTGKLPASSTPAIPEQLFVEAFLGRTLAELLQGQGSSAFLTVEPAPGSTALLAVPLNATAPVAQVS